MVVIEVESTIVTAIGQTPKKTGCGTQSFRLHVFPWEEYHDGFGDHRRLQIFKDGLSSQKRKYVAHAGGQRDIVGFILQKASNSRHDGLFGVSDAAQIRAQEFLRTSGLAAEEFLEASGHLV